jgi:hypothetical protein
MSAPVIHPEPRCFVCAEYIEAGDKIVYAPVCGHEECASAVFHGLCLVDNYDEILKVYAHDDDELPGREPDPAFPPFINGVEFRSYRP